MQYPLHLTVLYGLLCFQAGNRGGRSQRAHKLTPSDHALPQSVTGGALGTGSAAASAAPQDRACLSDAATALNFKMGMIIILNYEYFR
jgi:hypothetical protein